MQPKPKETATMNQTRTFCLIDGSSYIYRAFYAIGRLTNARGMPTQAIYGFHQMLLKVVREQQPDYVCVVFDAPGPSFRNEIYQQYKATRQKMPEDLAVQVPYIKELVRCHGIPQLEKEGYEADDLIAILTDWCNEQGIEAAIVSGDKDLMQLVHDPQVWQWDPQRDKVFREQQVFERFGVTPRQMADLLALMGDSSDNIPGVKGVGEKTAAKLLQQWGSLDEIFCHIEEVTPPSLRQKLHEHREEAYLSRQLVAFRKDMKIPGDPRDFVRSEPAIDDLMRLYTELDFHSLLKSLQEEHAGTAAAPEQRADASRHLRENRLVATEQELRALVEQLASQPFVAIELEPDSRTSMTAGIVGAAICCGDECGYYLPIAGQGSSDGQRLPLATTLAGLGPLLERVKPGKIGHNLKDLWVLLRRHGTRLQGIAFDTMIASYLLDPEQRAHSLDRLVAEHLGEKLSLPQGALEKGKKQPQNQAVGMEEAARRVCGAASAAWRMTPVLTDKLAAANLDRLYEELELPLLEVLAEMEYLGIAVDSASLEALSRELEKAMDRAAGMIYQLAGEEFNIQSPKQLAAILFDKLGLRPLKKTKTGPSTDINVLEQLAADHPIIEHVLHYRSLAKLKGTYTDSLPKLIHPETGRIHTSFNQTVTATGRLSSSNPNLQNIPIRSEEGRRIRQAFVASPGCLLMSADYSQIELRILAHYSQDEHLLQAFYENDDVHRRTAAEIFAIPPHEVTPEMRRQAKTINFGIIYGMGAFGLAQRLYISNKSAKVAIDRYFEKYRGVRSFIDSVVARAREAGYTETLLGRRRAVPELRSRNHNVRQQGERLAINTPIQGTAADLIKKAMIDLHRALQSGGLNTAMLLQVHDELLFEVPAAELDAAKQLIKAKMENVWELSVPLTVDIGWGENWAEAHA